MCYTSHMTAKDGKPCKKCGSSEWYKSGNCVLCNKEQGRKWRAANTERVIETRRKYYAENPDKQAVLNAKWRAAKPEKVNATARRYYNRKLSAGGKYTKAEWKALLKHFGNKCLCCGRTNVKVQADHVIPVTKGGTSNIDNIQPLCKSCNSRKGTKIIDYRTH